MKRQCKNSREFEMLNALIWLAFSMCKTEAERARLEAIMIGYCA